MPQFQISYLAGYSLYLVMGIAIAYLAGSLLIGLTRWDDIKYSQPVSLFLKLFVGILVCTTLYAVWKTNFKTVLLSVFFPCIFWIIVREKSKEKLYFHFEQKAILWFLAFVIISFSGFLLGWTYNLSHHTLNSIFDFHFYAEVSSFLNYSGIESFKFDFLQPQSASPFPYHYGLIWLNTFFSGLFHTNHMLTLLLVTMPFLFALAALGLTGLISILFPGKNYLFPLGILLWIVGPWGFLKLHIYTIFNETIDQTLSAEPKALFVYLFLLTSGIFYVKKDYVAALGFLILLPLFYLPVLPPFYVAVTLTILFLIYTKKIRPRQGFTGIGAMILSAVFIAVFYLTNRSVMNSSMFEGGMTLFSDFRGTVGAILRLTQLMIVSSIPFIILFILFRIIDRHKFKIQKEVMIFSVLLFCTSAITFGIYFNVVDAEQYFSKSFIPLLFILYALVLLYTFCSGSVLIKSLSVGMMVFALFYSRPFVYNYHNRAGLIVNKEVTEKFFQKLNTKDIQLRMAFINSDCFFKFSYRYNSRAYMPYKYFNYFVDPLVNTSLDYPSATDSITCDKDHGNPYTEENIRDKPFVRFVEHQRQEGDFKTLDDSRIRFIKKFRINTLVWDKNAKLYSGLSNMIDSSTILLDTLPNHHQTEYYIAELKSEF